MLEKKVDQVKIHEIETARKSEIKFTSANQDARNQTNYQKAQNGAKLLVHKSIHSYVVLTSDM